MRTRREVLGAVAAAPAVLLARRGPMMMTAMSLPTVPLLSRTIPRTGEKLPAIGLGTWQTFDVGARDADRALLRQVLDAFFAGGGRVIDSSPMYGRAEEVVGDLLAAPASAAVSRKPFLATKVWTTGHARGEEQMRASMRLMRTERMDLMQVHNLVDWRTHLETLRAWKKQGLVRYIGVTHYQLSSFTELERIVTVEDIDFVQLPYSIATRDAEARLLPAAAHHGVAVLVMRPFEEGALFARVRGKPLPDWAGDFDCASWAQFFLKFILSHPAVTCPIPATSNPTHLADNLRAGHGVLPDPVMRKKMIDYVGL
jgi:diketogulonate reductase-like aldo/keto reductase